VVAGAAAVIALGGLTAACGNSGKESPSSTTTVTTTTTTTTTEATTTSAPAAPSESVAPTQKSIDPTGGNLFTPSVVAPPAPTVPGGQHPGINGIP
jgi:predicted amino acid dehydrogenase